MPDPFDVPVEPAIVYEDPGLLAVYKPRRMHSAPGAEGGDLCAWLFERRPEAASVRAPASVPRRREGEGGLLHRLDYETSGLVLFARDDDTFAALLERQEAGLLLKEYLARSSSAAADGPAGSKPPRGAPLGIEAAAWAEAREGRDLERMASLLRSARASGAEPRIECAFRAFGPGGAAVACLDPGMAAGARVVVYRADLLDARVGGGGIDLTLGLAKGFRHQLRAQLAWIGLPIDGDPVYGGAPASRLYLHAARIAFARPGSGSPVVLGPGGLEGAGAAPGAMGAFASLLLGGNSGRL